MSGLPSNLQAYPAVLTRLHSLLSEAYSPAGVLIYLSAPNTWFDGRRPCDLVHERDIAGLTRLCDLLDPDGAYL